MFALMNTEVSASQIQYSALLVAPPVDCQTGSKGAVSRMRTRLYTMDVGL